MVEIHYQYEDSMFHPSRAVKSLFSEIDNIRDNFRGYDRNSMASAIYKNIA